MNERSLLIGGAIMSEPSPGRGEQTREIILNAAHHLFVKQGYHGTSMRQIASESGVALGGLYNHFNGKEAVFEAVYNAFHPYHQVFPAILEAQGENLDLLVRDAIERMVRVVEGRPDFMNLMFIEMVEFKSTHARQLFSSLLPEGMKILEHLVEQFPEQIRLIPPQMVVRTFLGLFFGYYLTEISLAQMGPIEFRENAMQYFVDIYLHGLIVPAG